LTAVGTVLGAYRGIEHPFSGTFATTDRTQVLAKVGLVQANVKKLVDNNAK
jgi:hypothetical protein